MIIDVHNQIIYDWISFTTRKHNLSQVLELFGFRPDTVIFKQQDGGRYFYRKTLYYEGIHIYYDGFSKERGDMGICVEMSGIGLRNWEEYGDADYDKLFKLILDNYSDDPEKRLMNLTRLDVAYDDFDGLLDLERIFSDADAGYYVSRLKTVDLHKKKQDGHLLGLTVAHGSMSSNVYIRIYDKRLEQKVDSYLPHWVRCEIQLRKENAVGFIMLKERIEKSYFDVLNQYLRYIVPVEPDCSNKRVVDSAPWWLNFIQSAESKSIFNKPKRDLRIENFMNFVDTQMSGAISTYVDLVGVESFLENISKARSGKVLNPRYKALKEKYDANGNGILEYLKKVGR